MADLTDQLENIARDMAYSGGNGGPRLIKKETIAHIQELHLAGMTTTEICRKLEEEKIRTPRGCTNWTPKTIRTAIHYKP